MGSSLGTFGAWPERDQIEAGNASPSRVAGCRAPRGWWMHGGWTLDRKALRQPLSSLDSVSQIWEAGPASVAQVHSSVLPNCMPASGVLSVCARTPVFTQERVCKCICACVLCAQLCPALWNPMDCSPPGSSVHGILQGRILEWDAISFSGGLPSPRIEPPSLAFPETAGGFFATVPPRETCSRPCTLTWFVDKSQCVDGYFVSLRNWLPGCPSNCMLGSASNRALPETFDCSPWCPLFQILAIAHCKFL